MKNALILFLGTPLRYSMYGSTKSHPCQEDNLQYMTYMNVGSADQTWSSYLPLHPWRFTGIVPDNSQHTTYKDVGSADHVWNSYRPLHPWRFTGIVPDNSQHTLHPWR